MENELLKGEMRLTESGYSKDFVDKNGNTMMVEFNLLGGNVLVAKDKLNEERYLSMNEYDLYREKYSDEDGYGEFYELYVESGDMLDMIGQDTRESNLLIISDKGYELFENDTLKKIQEIFIELSK